MKGVTILDILNKIEIKRLDNSYGFRLPIQWINRPHQDFRGVSGNIASGKISEGDRIRIHPGEIKTKIRNIFGPSGQQSTAEKGEAVTVVFDDEIDVSRGAVLYDEVSSPKISDQIQADIVWMDQSSMLPGRRYILKTTNSSVDAKIANLKYRLDVHDLNHEAAKTLELNEIGRVEITLSAPIAFDPYTDNRQMGAFVLIDRMTNRTVGAGMIRFGLRRAENIHWQATDIDQSARAEAKGQTPKLVWFTGLSASGKSTIANLVEKRLHVLGHHTYLLDGDNVRHGLNRDLGFTDADRVENIRRIGEVGKLMVDAGLIVLAAFISPFQSERRMVRDMMGKGEFVEVFVDTPLEVCEARDPKGLYARARAGEIKNFTGIDSPYERPKNADIVIDTTRLSAEEAVEKIITKLS